MNSIADATTVVFFREKLRKSGVIEELNSYGKGFAYEMRESSLRSQGAVKPMVIKLSKQLFSQFLGNAIPVKRTRKSRLGGCQIAGTKTQIDSKRKS